MAYKAALGLPPSTSNERLQALGLHNTFEELRAATLLGQREQRLDRSEAGRRVLADLNFPIRPHYCEEDLAPVSQTLRELEKL